MARRAISIFEGRTVEAKKSLVRALYRNVARRCGSGLLDAERWLAQRRALWERRLDRLEVLLVARSPTVDAPPTAPAAEPTEGELR